MQSKSSTHQHAILPAATNKSRMAEDDIEIIIPEDELPRSCAKCHTFNPEGSNFCLNCGVSLRPRRSDRATWIWLFVFVLVFIGLMVYFHRRISNLEPKTSSPKISHSAVPASRKTGSLPAAEDLAVQNEEEPPAEPQRIKIPMGLVVIKDITGKVINEIPAPVVGGGWVALPKRICLGGSDWTLKLGSGTEVGIVGGIYSDYDKIGLWRIREDVTIDGPELYPWRSGLSLDWLALSSLDFPEPLALVNPVANGHFMEGNLPEDFNEIGILVQQDRVVGWTFGDVITGGFLWNGDEGKYLRPELRVDDFYRITFANSREEEFVRALAMKDDYSDLERLEAFANAFRFESKLSTKDTPVHLQTKTLIDHMRGLIANAMKAGAAREVVNAFDNQILSAAGDIGLLMDVAQATAISYGFEDAVELIDAVADSLASRAQEDRRLLEKFYATLYQNWIVDSLQKGSLQNAWRAYRLGSRKLPEDLGIHLLGVELALADDDWEEAERLLSAKDYPASLNDKIQNLQSRISELKAREGKIVIRFTPGSRQIPLTAVVNRSVYQSFIIDTGASMVTIPRSAAEDLGLVSDDRSSMRRVLTAGGVRFVPEVTLSSITVEGWEVNNVQALVMDIPEQPTLGLLGLNYLRRFRMDMNTEKGILLLEPR